MKLRLAADALRLRLDPAELPVLATAGRLDAATPLPDGGALCYGVALGAATALAATGGAILVTLARADAAPLLDGTLEGVHADLPLPAGGTLRLVVERDRGAKQRP